MIYIGILFNEIIEVSLLLVSSSNDCNMRLIILPSFEHLQYG